MNISDDENHLGDVGTPPSDQEMEISEEDAPAPPPAKKPRKKGKYRRSNHKKAHFDPILTSTPKPSQPSPFPARRRPRRQKKQGESSSSTPSSSQTDPLNEAPAMQKSNWNRKSYKEYVFVK
jgi:hypothetical protein